MAPEPLDERASRVRGPRAAVRVRTLLLAVAVGLLAAPATPEPARAQAAEPPAWAYKLPYDLMSPFCPGRTLADCPSPQASELKVWILTQAAAGASRDEVVANLYQRFGEVLRSTPKAEGFGLTAYLLPLIGGVAGALVLVLALQRLVKRPERSESRVSRGAPASAAVDEEELARQVDEELARSG